MLAPPIARLDAISRDELNECLTAWGHRMGPWNRPSNREWFWGLYHHDQLVAVAAAGDLINERCAGLDRTEAFELGRLCAAQPDLCRAMLRLWRAFVFPAISQAHGYSWVVSYQDAVLHSGNTYRFDGWVQLGKSRSGPDRRSGRRGRSKVIWGWSADEGAMSAVRAAA